MKIVDASGNTVYDNLIGTADNTDLTTYSDPSPQSPIALGGGSIVIHEVKSGKATTQTARWQDVELVPEMNAEFGVKAYPNPSAHQFSIKLQSSNTTDPITLRVIDHTGRVVRLIPGLTAGQTIQLGSEYKPGVYIIESIQGTNRKQLKLLKQPN